jgi:hypothetical protein
MSAFPANTQQVCRTCKGSGRSSNDRRYPCPTCFDISPELAGMVQDRPPPPPMLTLTCVQMMGVQPISAEHQRRLLEAGYSSSEEEARRRFKDMYMNTIRFSKQSLYPRKFDDSPY